MKEIYKYYRKTNSVCGNYKQEHDDKCKELNLIHRKQLQLVWNNKRIYNNQLEGRSKKKPLSTDMKETWWRTFGHIVITY